MDYIIYIVIAFLGVIFLVVQGFARRKFKDRKSRRFMEDHKSGKRSNPKDRT